LINRYYHKYATKNPNGEHRITESGLSEIFQKIGLHAFTEKNGIAYIYQEIDINKDTNVSEEELLKYVYENFVQNDALTKYKQIEQKEKEDKVNDVEEEEEEEDDEIPEDLKDLDPSVRVQKLIIRSLQMMSFGTLIVLIFSDPMVNVLSDFGTLTGINAF